MPVAQSKFIFGGHEFVVPQLHAVVLHEIREFGRNIDKAIPNVERVIVLGDILAMLLPDYPWLTAAWLDANLTTEAAAGIISNLCVQMDLAIAARKAPAPAVGAQVGLH